MVSSHTKKNKLYIFGIIIFATQFINIVRYEMDLMDISFFVASLIFSFFYFTNVKGGLRDNFAILFLIFYIYISTIAASAFRLLGDEYTYHQYQALASFAGKLYFFCFFAIFFFQIFQINSQSCRHLPAVEQKPFRKSFVYFVFFFSFLLPVISVTLGVGKMGMEAIVLPFHLSGVIQMLKNIVPFLFMLILIKNIKNVKQLRYFFILIAIWGLFDSFVVFSKSRLISAFLPIIVYYAFYLKRINRKIILPIVLIVVLFVFLYPFIGYFRMMVASGVSQEEAIALAIEKQEDKKDGRIIAIYKRTFSLGNHYMSDMPFIQSNSLFDFSKAPVIWAMGGSARYQTVVVDNFPVTAIHSSGTTGLTDALLLGGYGLCYITLILLVMAAFFIDSNKIKKNICLRVFLLIIFTEIVRTRTYTYFFDGIAIPVILTNLLIFYIIRKTYKPVK